MLRKVLERRLARRHESILLNLTPMIDVMTVLLAVFMVTAPLLTSGLDMKLPDGGQSVLSGNDRVVISVNQEGQIYVAQRHLALRHMLVKVKSLAQNNPKAQIVIRADDKTSYGKVIRVMGILRDAGFKNVGLQTASPRS
ncbi:MAG: biopolymer transporter ExbD [Alphaproteobacteria bacterium]|nr:biopolymer transporter ExbD [Alphaproteobacteria bacterium]